MIINSTYKGIIKSNILTPSIDRRIGIIAWGQSNLGTGVTNVASNLEVEYKKTYNNVKFYQHNSSLNTSFVPMDYQDNSSYQAPDQNATYSLQFYLYPEVASLLGKDLHVVHHGQGDTGLAVEWKSTATIGDMYLQLRFKTLAFQNAVQQADGIGPDIKFMLMVHGEYDSRLEVYANAYETNLTNFINNFRSQIGLSNLPVIIVLLNPDGEDAAVNPLTYADTIRTAQTNVGGALSDVYTVESIGAELHTDEIHYTVAGEHTLATRILTCITSNGLV